MDLGITLIWRKQFRLYPIPRKHECLGSPISQLGASFRGFQRGQFGVLEQRKIYRLLERCSVQAHLCRHDLDLSQFNLAATQGGGSSFPSSDSARIVFVKPARCRCIYRSWVCGDGEVGIGTAPFSCFV